jgi:hypothetical protein
MECQLLLVSCYEAACTRASMRYIVPDLALEATMSMRIR